MSKQEAPNNITYLPIDPPGSIYDGKITELIAQGDAVLGLYLNNRKKLEKNSLFKEGNFSQFENDIYAAFFFYDLARTEELLIRAYEYSFDEDHIHRLIKKIKELSADVLSVPNIAGTDIASIAENYRQTEPRRKKPTRLYCEKEMNALVDKIAINLIPYAITMLDHLKHNRASNAICMVLSTHTQKAMPIILELLKGDLATELPNDVNYNNVYSQILGSCAESETFESENFLTFFSRYILMCRNIDCIAYMGKNNLCYEENKKMRFGKHITFSLSKGGEVTNLYIKGKSFTSSSNLIQISNNSSPIPTSQKRSQTEVTCLKPVK